MPAFIHQLILSHLTSNMSSLIHRNFNEEAAPEANCTIIPPTVKGNASFDETGKIFLRLKLTSSGYFSFHFTLSFTEHTKISIFLEKISTLLH